MWLSRLSWTPGPSRRDTQYSVSGKDDQNVEKRDCQGCHGHMDQAEGIPNTHRQLKSWWHEDNSLQPFSYVISWVSLSKLLSVLDVKDAWGQCASNVCNTSKFLWSLRYMHAKRKGLPILIPDHVLWLQERQVPFMQGTSNCSTKFLPAFKACQVYCNGRLMKERRNFDFIQNVPLSSFVTQDVDVH